VQEPEVNTVELIVVDRIKSDAAGTPVGLPERLSNPTRAGVLVAGAGKAIVTVIVPAVPAVAAADNERNWSLPSVVVAVTYSSGMV